MEDLTKEPESKHRMLMVSHTPQMPPKAVFVSKSCPDFVTEYADDMSSVSSLQYMKCCSCSLPSQLNVAAKEVIITIYTYKEYLNSFLTFYIHSLSLYQNIRNVVTKTC